MKLKSKIILLCISLILAAVIIVSSAKKEKEDDSILSYIVDTKVENLQFYWKDEFQVPFKSIQNLKNNLEQKNLVLKFAMNGGMYGQDNIPQGLFIQDNKTITPIDTASGNGNFYLKPNGVFYLTNNNTPAICKTADLVNNGMIKFATQSGPMLVFEGKLHPAFNKGSTNLNIRNGVGILPNNKVVFALSKSEINFYDFAKFFQNLGCKNALYLDGFVSRAYLPDKKWRQTDGDFGVIIGVTTKNNK